jgi:hypothetical protein
MPAEIEIEGKKFDLGADFEVNNGPIGLRDFIGMVRSSLSQTSYGRILESVLLRLEKGDVMTAAALGVTVAVGVYVVYSIWTSESSNDASTDHGKAESPEEEKVPPRDFTTEQLVSLNMLPVQKTKCN